MKGKISSRDRGETKVIADEIYTLDEALKFLSRKVHVTLRSDQFGEKELEDLKETVGRHAGERDLILHWRKNGSERYVVRSRNTSVAPGLDFFEELKRISGVEHVEVSR